MHFSTLLSSAFAAMVAATSDASGLPGIPSRLRARADNNTTYVGPENGHLVIVGGNLHNVTIWERIISLAGGPDAPFVVIPTADGAPTYDQDFSIAVTLRELGATNVTVVHTYDPAVADTDEFIAPILAAKGLFFGGGRQWRLVDAYAGTKTEAAFHSILDRGGVISGSSAGATIQGSFLTRGDTASSAPVVGDHKVGFGFLKNSAIDQHILVRNRHFDLYDVLKLYPELLGIGIDEDTALVVNKNDVEVIGSTYAAFWDGTFWSREGQDVNTLPPPESRFYFLKAGDRYDLGQRKVVDDGSGGSGDDW